MWQPLDPIWTDPPQQASSSWDRSLLLALFASLLLIHGPLLFLLSQEDLFQNTLTPPAKLKPLVMIPLQDRPATAPSLPLIDMDKPAQESIPDAASAQGLYNQKVDGPETVAARTQGQSGAPGAPAAPIPPAQPKAPAAPQPQAPKPASTPNKPQPQAPKTPPRPEAKAKTTPSAPPPPKNAAPLLPPAPVDETPPLPTTPPANQQENTLESLRQQFKSKDQRIAQLTQSQAQKNPPTVFKNNLGGGGDGAGDFLPNYQVGNRTYVNTLANPHVQFYVELKRKFRLAFNPGPVLRQRVHQLQSRQIAVVWGLSVDQNGKITGLTLLKSSGLEAYDFEAKRTINVSAPFTNPPANLLSADGQTHVAWTFVVYF